MRYVAAIEGKPTKDGRLIVHGALTMEDEKIPVVRNFDQTQIVGVATDFQRDEDTGEISFEVSSEEDFSGMCAATFIRAAEVSDRDDLTVVTKGIVREIAFIPAGTWAWDTE